MRVSVFRRQLGESSTQRTPDVDAAPVGGETGAAAESVDEQIESLLASLQETDAFTREPYSLPGEPVRPRSRRRRRRRLASYDLVFTVTAAVLGLAVGVLTAVLLNG